jgi:hypothetical protein
MENKYIWKCEICGADMPDYEPEYCCDGTMCGCMGMPISPPVCSNECFYKLMYGGAEHEMDKCKR